MAVDSPLLAVRSVAVSGSTPTGAVRSGDGRGNVCVGRTCAATPACSNRRPDCGAVSVTDPLVIGRVAGVVHLGGTGLHRSGSGVLAASGFNGQNPRLRIGGWHVVRCVGLAAATDRRSGTVVPLSRPAIRARPSDREGSFGGLRVRGCSMATGDGTRSGYVCRKIRCASGLRPCLHVGECGFQFLDGPRFDC